MKKYRITLIVTSIILTFMLVLSASAGTNNAKAVKVTKAVEKDIYNTIVCKGDVELANSVSITTDNPCVVVKSYIKEGDRIKKGQKLFDVVYSDAEIPSIGDAYESVIGMVTDGIDLPNSFDYQSSSQTTDIDNGPIVEIFSEKNGTVIQTRKENEYVFAGIPLCKVGDMNNLMVRAKIPENLINLVKAGQTVNLTGDAFGDKTYQGKVSQIMPTAKKTISISGVSNEAYVDVLIDISSDGKIRPGYTADVKIFTDYIKNATLVPYECVFQEEDEYVFIVEDGVLRKQQVETGYEITDGIQVTSGVKSGDIVVIEPDESLVDGEMIKIEN